MVVNGHWAPGADDAAEGTEPALVAGLHLRCAGVRSAVLHPVRGGRLHARMPGACGRYVAVGRQGGSGAQRDFGAPRLASGGGKRQRRGTDLDLDPALVAGTAGGVAPHRPGKPTQNAFVEGFNGRLRDE